MQQQNKYLESNGTAESLIFLKGSTSSFKHFLASFLLPKCTSCIQHFAHIGMLSVELCKDYRLIALIVLPSDCLLVWGAGLLSAQLHQRLGASSKELGLIAEFLIPRLLICRQCSYINCSLGETLCQSEDCLFCLHQAFQHCYFLTGTDHFIPETLLMYLTMSFH